MNKIKKILLILINLSINFNAYSKNTPEQPYDINRVYDDIKEFIVENQIPISLVTASFILGFMALKVHNQKLATPHSFENIKRLNPSHPQETPHNVETPLVSQEIYTTTAQSSSHSQNNDASIGSDGSGMGNGGGNGGNHLNAPSPPPPNNPPLIPPPPLSLDSAAQDLELEAIWGAVMTELQKTFAGFTQN